MRRLGIAIPDKREWRPAEHMQQHEARISQSAGSQNFEARTAGVFAVSGLDMGSQISKQPDPNITLGVHAGFLLFIYPSCSVDAHALLRFCSALPPSLLSLSLISSSHANGGRACLTIGRRSRLQPPRRRRAALVSRYSAVRRVQSLVMRV